MNLHVVTYNLLSPSLCNSAIFVRSSKRTTRESNRLQLLYQKLQAEICRGSIICLQELTPHWYALLAKFFYDQNYLFYATMYGQDHWRMGVAIAFPSDRFRLMKVDVLRVGDLVPKNPYETASGGVFKWYKHAAQTTTDLVNWTKPARGPFRLQLSANKTLSDHAREKPNEALLMKLHTFESGAFVVATYHMPCEFRRPAIQVLHHAMLLKAIRDFAADDSLPVILAGDWNMKQSNQAYQALRFGDLMAFSREFPDVKDDCFYPSLQMRSAYEDCIGKEPDFTCKTVTSHNGEFQGTIDYIWVSPEITVEDVDPVASLHPEEYLPNEREPSDHLMIGATLSFQKPNKVLVS